MMMQQEMAAKHIDVMKKRKMLEEGEGKYKKNEMMKKL